MVKKSGVTLNGVPLTDKQADEFGASLNKLYEKGRKLDLQKIVSEHKTEVSKLPQIFKIRIEALKEVNPETFSTSPELVLSSLVATYLIKTLLKDFKTGPQDLHKQDVYKQAHKLYGLNCGSDVNPFLVSELVWAYYDDVNGGVIDKNGKVIGDLTQSKVMKVVHNSKDNGIPNNAKNVMLGFMSRKR